MRFALPIVAVICAAPVLAQQAPAPRIERADAALDALIAPDAKVERVATGFTFVEGPLWHRGKLWFSDVNGDKLRTVTRDGKVVELLDNSGGLPNPPKGKSIGSNGLVPAADGRVLMAQMGARRIVKVDEAGRVEPFLDRLDGKRLNSPNDMVHAPDGSLWITDPPFGLYNGMDKDPAKELPFNPVLRYADGKLTAPITDLVLPNGIGLSPKGDTLYIADFGQATIFAYPIARGGKLGTRRTVFTFPKEPGGGADGLKVDKRGNIWATGPGGIWIMTPAGKQLGRIRLPEVAANIAFGEGGNAAWITASKSVYRVPIKGVGMLPRFAK
ncbi:gluconolactonase [Sphingomonas spermidinifaciens]|uniref:Gluconolactonase n=1 Tax=Sphingomonas spermidinifaciens TaxID=1141889 RepID=A0A2A4B2J6_9SPHN|nr:SMP-30/gluconolactonase/LRE family protein [Sphingomonas spermidinifaciens]PCD03423.1 gluconolactonase [Sphingomonas spermidinifaciens]